MQRLLAQVVMLRSFYTQASLSSTDATKGPSLAKEIIFLEANSD
ncbi:MAG: hypothetical protein ACI9T7_002247 [Oleiphilaceae bacterium]|jgi:hypothetical protein